MPRDRAESPADQVMAPSSEPGGSPLYRVVGVEPHGWSTVLVERSDGRFYIAATATGLLTEVGKREAKRLIQHRAYRSWHGDRHWSTIDRLPLLAQDFGRASLPEDLIQEESPF